MGLELQVAIGNVLRCPFISLDTAVQAARQTSLIDMVGVPHNEDDGEQKAYADHEGETRQKEGHDLEAKRRERRGWAVSHSRSRRTEERS